MRGETRIDRQLSVEVYRVATRLSLLLLGGRRLLCRKCRRPYEPLPVYKGKTLWRKRHFVHSSEYCEKCLDEMIPFKCRRCGKQLMMPFRFTLGPEPWDPAESFCGECGSKLAQEFRENEEKSLKEWQ